MDLASALSPAAFIFVGIGIGLAVGLTRDPEHPLP